MFPGSSLTLYYRGPLLHTDLVISYMFRSSSEETDLALCLGALGTMPNQPGQARGGRGVLSMSGQAQPADFGKNLLIAVRNYNRLTKEDYEDRWW